MIYYKGSKKFANGEQRTQEVKSMNFAASLVIVLILVGILTLIYVVGGILEALSTYIRHTKERKRKGREQHSPMANSKIVGRRKPTTR